MDNALGHSIKKLREVGGFSQKMLAVFLSVLLALMCLPILPKQAQAETVTSTIIVPHTDNVSFSTGSYGVDSPYVVAQNWWPEYQQYYAGIWCSPSGGNHNQLHLSYSGFLQGSPGTFQSSGTVPFTETYVHPGTGSTYTANGSVTYSYKWVFKSDGSLDTAASSTPSCVFSGTWSGPEGTVPIPANGGTANIPVSWTTTQTVTNTYNPTATANDYIVEIDDPIPAQNWTEGVSGAWGHTTTNLITPTDTTYGTITDNSLPSSLPVTAGKFTAMGWENHSYTVKDTSDNTTATTNRNIIVQAVNAPDLDITYAPGAMDKDTNPIPAGTPYTSSGDSYYSTGWTNQDLSMKVSTTEPGNYDATLKRSGAEYGFATDADYITTYGTNSPTTAGEDFTGILLGTGNHAIELSPESSVQNVKIDKVNPIPGATYSAGVFTDTSSDALSGIDSTRQKVAVVPTTTTPPVDSDYESFSAITVTTPDFYDIYVWAWDNAGNNDKQMVASNVLIMSTEKPTITAELDDGFNTSHPTSTWTNQDVIVTVTPPSPEIGGNYYSALYTMPATQDAKASVIQTPVSHTYTSETASSILYGVLVDAADVELSAKSVTYELKIDKTAPTGDSTFNNGVGTPAWGFTDISSDNGAVQSLVDSSKTIVGIVPHGDPQPVKAAYESISTAEIPATGYYDVWVIATDNAGNESVPVEALTHISRSGVDEINAKDFSYDIASGGLSLDDAMAKMLSHVEGKPFGGGTPFNVTTQITVDPAELAALQTAINNGEKGTKHPLTFYTPAGLTQADTTIQVTIYDSGSNPGTPPGPMTHEMIYANDFNWGISTGAMDDNAARVASQVVGYDMIGDPIASGSLSVDGGELGAINSAIASGQKDTTWPLTFYTPDNTSVTINVTLFDKGPVTPPQAGHEMIVGNDFSWGISTGALSVTETLFLSNASATSASGAPMAQSTIVTDPADFADINAAISAGQKGTKWPITLTTDGSSGTAVSTTVYVTLYDAGPPAVQAGDEMVVGNNFSWGISAGVLDEPGALVLSYAKAFDANGFEMAISNVTVDPLELADINTAITAGQKGTTWPLTLNTNGLTGTPASAVVYVTLYDNGPNVPPMAGSEHIFGNDFNWGISTGSLGKDDAGALALINATDANGANMTLSQISLNTAEIDAINAAIAAGKKDTTWPLTFTTDGSTGTASSVTVNVKLFDNGPAGPFAPGSEHIVGNNFKWGIDSGTLTDTHAEHLSRVTGTSALGLPMTMASGEISFVQAELDAINAAITAGSVGSVLPLTFSTDGSTGPAASVTIYVTLYDAGHPAPNPGDPYIVSSHFNHPVSSGVLADNDVKTLSAVEALASDATVGADSDIAVDATQLSAVNDAITAGDISTVLPLTFTYTCPQSGKAVHATSMVTLTGTSDLEVTKAVDSDSPVPGDIVTYTITAKNNGDATAQGLWIKDNLPAHTIFVSCDASGTYGASLSGQEYVHWFIPTLAPGETVSLTVKVKIDDCAPGTVIENIALYEEGVSGLPSNLDDDPQGGQTTPASSTVAEGSAQTASAGNAGGKLLAKMGDMIPFVLLGAGVLAACVLVLIARRKSKKEKA